VKDDDAGLWFLVPLLFTMLTLCTGLAGLLLWPRAPALNLLGMSLMCDMIDGPLARAMEVRTRLGAWFAWSVDVCLGYGLAWKLPMPWSLIAVCWLVVVQTESRERDVRLSGRGLLFVVVIAFGGRW